MLEILISTLHNIGMHIAIYLILAICHAALGVWKILKKDWLSGGCYLIAVACYLGLAMMQIHYSQHHTETNHSRSLSAKATVVVVEAKALPKPA